MNSLTRNNIEIAPMPPGLMLLLWRYLASELLHDEAKEQYEATQHPWKYTLWMQRAHDRTWAYAELYHTLTPHFRVRFRAGGYEVAQVHADRSRDLRTLRIRQYR